MPLKQHFASLGHFYLFSIHFHFPLPCRRRWTPLASKQTRWTNIIMFITILSSILIIIILIYVQGTWYIFIIIIVHQPFEQLSQSSSSYHSPSTNINCLKIVIHHPSKVQVLKKCFDGFADEEGAIPADQVANIFCFCLHFFWHQHHHICLSECLKYLFPGWWNPGYDGNESEAFCTERDHWRDWRRWCVHDDHHLLWSSWQAFFMIIF